MEGKELIKKLVYDHTRIKNKTNELEDFILFNPKFNEINKEHKSLLKLQLLAMKTYKECLKNRIELLVEKE